MKQLDWEDRILPPVRRVMESLESAGYQAWLVGGALRDLLRGQTPQDYDIATDATPEQVGQIFGDCPLNREGASYGVTRVKFQQTEVEIAVFRRESGYRDGRRPDVVTPAAEIQQDLVRRDFTVNAMAYRPGAGLLDLWGGLEDLENRLIRTVGLPDRRFSEDGLRLLRAMRFAAVLDFRIEEQTALAMDRQKGMLDAISQPRVGQELAKLLQGPAAARVLGQFPLLTGRAVPELAPMVGFQQHSSYHIYDVWQHTLAVLEGTPPDLVTRTAALLHDVGKPGCFVLDANGRGRFRGHGLLGAQMADQILGRLSFPGNLRRQVCQLIQYHDEKIPPTEQAVRLWLNRLGPVQLGRLLDLQQADSLAKAPRCDTQFPQALRQIMDQVLERGDCLTLSGLAIGGRELGQMGLQGRQIGQVLERLLEQVLAQPELNQRERLLALARQYLEEEVR